MSTAVIAVVAIAAAAAVYVRDGRDHFLSIFGNDLALFGEMLPKVLAGCLIGAFVTMILPRELVARWVGHESGFTGLVVAAFFGFLLPGGPITIYPVAGAFLVMGADAGAVVAFITAWTLCGYTRALVWELPFFGPHFVIWRIVEAIPLPLIAGLLARADVAALLSALNRDGEEARIVGGAVRNALLGEPVADIDVATTCLPDETMRRVRAAGFKAVPTGVEHGTVTVVIDGTPFEVTTLRRDIETDGRHAVVAFGRDFREDALRRDFTINALGLDAAGGRACALSPDAGARRAVHLRHGRTRHAD